MAYFSMNKKKLSITLLFVIMLSSSLVSANFACGFVNDSSKLAASWTEVLISYDENPFDLIVCKTTPENKFCCDLETINSVDWSVGKLIHAEVFNSELGYIAGPVSRLTTEEGFDVFPDMQLRKAINFNKPLKTILINTSEVLFDLSIDQNYNNLKYKLNQNNEVDICQGCTEAQFTIQELSKGNNEIKLTVYNVDSGKEISETFFINSLNYLDIIDSFDCEKCEVKGKKVYIYSNSEVNLELKLSSSHDFSGIINIYFPTDWELDESFLSEDYSVSHDLFKWNINDSSNELISLPFTSSKTSFKRKESFKYEFSDFSKETKIFVYSIIKRLPFNRQKKFSNDFYFEDSLSEIISPAEPIILTPEQDIFELIAIYPKQESNNAYAYITYKQRNFFNRKYIKFNLLSNIASRKIEKILFRFKVPKEDSISFYYIKENINLEIYESDTVYNYYEAYVDKKGSFRIKIS
jgi:hypothetical protein